MGGTTVGTRLRLILVGVITGLAFASSANAAPLSGVLPGIVSPSDTPATCDTSVSQPFLPWGDSSYYVLAPGGSFEGGAAGWSLAGGARVVNGNESFYVRARSDHQSLYLPAGSTATTPAMCFAFGDWHLRFFTQSSSTSRSSLRVNVVVKSLCGVLSILDGGTVSDDNTWSPSPRLKLALTNITGLLATDSVSFQFVPGDRASWRIDDVYLDPWKSG
jgi:hypothetical protein